VYWMLIVAVMVTPGCCEGASTEKGTRLVTGCQSNSVSQAQVGSVATMLAEGLRQSRLP
jgi:hypothetical protein